MCGTQKALQNFRLDVATRLREYYRFGVEEGDKRHPHRALQAALLVEAVPTSELGEQRAPEVQVCTLESVKMHEPYIAAYAEAATKRGHGPCV